MVSLNKRIFINLDQYNFTLVRFMKSTASGSGLTIAPMRMQLSLSKTMKRFKLG